MDQYGPHVRLRAARGAEELCMIGATWDGTRRGPYEYHRRRSMFSDGWRRWSPRARWFSMWPDVTVVATAGRSCNNTAASRAALRIAGFGGN